jgi:hypothetical protein
MLKLLKVYVVMVSKSWGKAISGPVLAVISLVLLFLQQTVRNETTAARLLKWGAWLTLGMAFVLVLVAQYKVWKEEHEGRCKAEAELNTEADMRGTIWVTVQGGHVPAVQVNSDCSNHGRTSCEISKLTFVVSHPDLPEHKVTVPLAAASVQTVAYGKKFNLSEPVQLADLTIYQLKQSDVQVHLVDSLGVEYPNTTTERSN